MSKSPVYVVLLRRPRMNDPNERRDDPFYEFGSFGCTRCHSKNLLNPRNSARLQGARLAFVQGGSLGARLVFLTPPVTIRVWDGSCEAIWTPRWMPFKYVAAPIIVSNNGTSDFALFKDFVRKANRTTIEGKISSLFRSRTAELPFKIADQVVMAYDRLRAKAKSSAIASTYEEALPYAPPNVDRSRRATYRSRVSMLRHQLAENEKDSTMRKRRNRRDSSCSSSPRWQQTQAKMRCS